MSPERLKSMGVEDPKKPHILARSGGKSGLVTLRHRGEKKGARHPCFSPGRPGLRDEAWD